MHLEAVQIIANALADSRFGVNVVLDQIPRTDQRRPPNIQVYDETRTGWVSRLTLPEDQAEVPDESVVLPALIVVLGGPISWTDKARPTRDAASQLATQVTIATHYITREADTQLAAVDAMLSLRAVRGVLRMLAQPVLVAARALHDVRLEGLVDTQYAKQFTPIEDVVLAGAVLTTWTARETLPTYMP